MRGETMKRPFFVPSMVILLVFEMVFVQNASALFLLEDSTFGQAEGWEGSRIYEEGDFAVLIDFTVYDTGSSMTQEETDFTSAFGLTGQYIYA